MEARILDDRDVKQYLNLRTRATSETSSYACREFNRELLLFADNPSRAMSAHQKLGTLVWGVHDVSLVGVIAVSERYNSEVQEHWWLWGFYVLPRYRGTPASGMLMRAALEWCREQPKNNRVLSSFHAPNYHARQYLERWGFRRQLNTENSGGLGGVGNESMVVERD